MGQGIPGPSHDARRASDRLVHHATILEMNVESYRRRVALDQAWPGSSANARDN
jgi:hypothetical protein